MKVLRLVASQFFGGPERVMTDIMRTQRQLGFDVENHVALFAENGNYKTFQKELDRAEIQCEILPHDMPRLIAATFDLIRLFRREKYDLVLAHGYKARLLGWPAARRVGIPIVGVSHGWTWQNWKVAVYDSIDKWVHRRMDHILTVSQGQAEKIYRLGVPKNRVTVIHNAIDANKFTNAADKSYREKLENYFDDDAKPKKIILCAGRLSIEKGFDVMIDVAARLAERFPNGNRFGFVLFGEGSERNTLQKKIDDLGVSKIFKMVGFTSEIHRFLLQADIYAQSSHTEGFPCANLEAMTAGLPLVATAVGGVPEQIIPEQTGLLVPPNNPTELADALARLIDDDDLCREWGESGRRRVLAEFTCDRQAEKYHDFFRTQLSRTRS